MTSHFETKVTSQLLSTLYLLETDAETLIAAVNEAAAQGEALRRARGRSPLPATPREEARAARRRAAANPPAAVAPIAAFVARAGQRLVRTTASTGPSPAVLQGLSERSRAILEAEDRAHAGRAQVAPPAVRHDRFAVRAVDILSRTAACIRNCNERLVQIEVAYRRRQDAVRRARGEVVVDDHRVSLITAASRRASAAVDAALASAYSEIEAAAASQPPADRGTAIVDALERGMDALRAVSRETDATVLATLGAAHPANSTPVDLPRAGPTTVSSAAPVPAADADVAGPSSSSPGTSTRPTRKRRTPGQP